MADDKKTALAKTTNSPAERMTEAAGREYMSLVKQRRRTTMSEWLQEAMACIDRDGERCIAFALVHLRGTVPDEMHLTRLGGKDWTADQLAALYERKANTRAQDLPGDQTFNVLAFFAPTDKALDKPELAVHEAAGAGALPPGDKYIFTVRGRLPEGADAYSSLGTEAPTNAGAMQMGMRLVSEMFAGTRAQQNLIFAQQTQMIGELHRRALDSEHEAREAFLVVKDMIEKQMQMQHDHKIKELEFARATEERRLWMSFGPPLLNTIAGREIFPMNLADTQMIDTLAELVDEDTVMQLGSALSKKHPDKVAMFMGPLMARFEAAMKKKQLRAEQASEITKRLGPSADPEADAAGGTNPALPAKGGTT